MTDNITLPRATVQQALEAWDDPMKDLKDMCVAMDAIRTALEQQQAEPVAWIAEVELSVFARTPKEKTTVEIWKKPVLDSDVAIYTTPPQQQAEPVQKPKYMAQSNGRHSPLLTHMMNKRTALAEPEQSFEDEQRVINADNHRRANALEEAIHAAWSAGYVEGEKAVLEQQAEPVEGNTLLKSFLAAAKEAGVTHLQQAEPVAWTTMPEAEDWCFVSGGKDPTGKLEGKWFPLYTTPPQRKPLTVKEINALPEAKGYWPIGMNDRIVRLIRAVEATHGIKEGT